MEKTTFKILTLMLFGLFATSCDKESIEPKLKSLADWNQSGAGTTWYYNYQNEFLYTAGSQQSKLISNPVKSPKGKHKLEIEVDNWSLSNDVKIYVYTSLGDQVEGLGGITLLPGKVSYTLDINAPIDGHIGLQVAGDSFNLEVLNVSFDRSRKGTDNPPKPRRR